MTQKVRRGRVTLTRDAKSRYATRSAIAIGMNEINHYVNADHFCTIYTIFSAIFTNFRQNKIFNFLPPNVF
jgi:hypothetical protein